MISLPEKRNFALVATILALAPGIGGCALSGEKSLYDTPDLVSCADLAAAESLDELEAIDPRGNGTCREADGTIHERAGGRG